MSRIVLVATVAIALFALSGCQSEEEKRVEHEKLVNEIRQQVYQDVMNQIPGVVRDEFQRQLEEHKRKMEAERAAADAAKTAPKPAVTPEKPAAKPAAPAAKPAAKPSKKH